MFFLLALGGPRRVVSAPWLNPVHPLVLETVSPAQIARLQQRLAGQSPDEARPGPGRLGADGGGHRPAGRRRRADRRRHRWRRPDRRSVRRLDRAHRGREHGGRRDDAGPGADGGDAQRRGHPRPRRPRRPSPPGKSADFIVLDANPLDDITNTRRIAQVYLRGMAVDRARLGAQWTGSRPRPGSPGRAGSGPCAPGATGLSWPREPGRARRGRRPLLRRRWRRLVVRVGRPAVPGAMTGAQRRADAARGQTRGACRGRAGRSPSSSSSAACWCCRSKRRTSTTRCPSPASWSSPLEPRYAEVMIYFHRPGRPQRCRPGGCNGARAGDTWRRTTSATWWTRDLGPGDASVALRRTTPAVSTQRIVGSPRPSSGRPRPPALVRAQVVVSCRERQRLAHPRGATMSTRRRWIATIAMAAGFDRRCRPRRSSAVRLTPTTVTLVIEGMT